MKLLVYITDLGKKLASLSLQQLIAKNGELFILETSIWLRWSQCCICCKHNKKQVTISSNSTFNNNSALYGGGKMFLGINSTKSFVMIQNSIFNSNTAMKGSGIDVICENTCHNNTINISSSQFKNNEISQIKFNDKGGSGIAIGISGHQFGVPDGNNFILHNCVFTKNKALFGGGTYIHCGQQFLNKVVNRINFTNCIWKNNLAPISPAVDVSAGYSSVSQTQYNIVNVTFTNCTFIKNKVDHYYFFNGSQSFLNTKQYTGTFLVMQVPVDFAGNTSFTDNYGTAILVSSSVITFLESSNVLFCNNTGMFGGAMTLMGFSRLQYQDNTIFNFVRNTATVGGAINVCSFDQHLYYYKTYFLGTLW